MLYALFFILIIFLISYYDNIQNNEYIFFCTNFTSGELLQRVFGVEVLDAIVSMMATC